MAAYGLARQLIHRNDMRRGDELRSSAHVWRQGRQLGLDVARMSDEERVKLRIFTQGAHGTGDALARPVIAAHYVDRDGQHVWLSLRARNRMRR